MDENTQTLAIAVDGSDTALQAVRQGIALVQGGLNAQLALLHVQEPATFLELATNDSDLIAGAALGSGQRFTGQRRSLGASRWRTLYQRNRPGRTGHRTAGSGRKLNASMLIIGARGVGRAGSVR